jgi:hypothetical protein
MLDLPVESSQANQNLMFGAFTDHIPPLGTKVRLILTPRLPATKKSPGKQPTATTPVKKLAPKSKRTKENQRGS